MVDHQLNNEILAAQYKRFERICSKYFKTLEELQRVAKESYDGDDIADARLWCMYKDIDNSLISSHEEMRIRGRSLPVRDAMNLMAYEYHKKVVATSNPEAIGLLDGLKLGGRKSHDESGLRGHYDNNNTFAVAVKHMFSADSRDEIIRGIKKVLSVEIPAIEECAKAGDMKAARSLSEMYETDEWGYHDDANIWLLQDVGPHRHVSNPYYDKSKANYWKEIADFLDNKDNNNLLDSFILTQDKTAEGMYNIGVALYNNEHLRGMYNAKLDKIDHGARKPSDFHAAEDFLKKSYDMGCVNAAWFMGDQYQKMASGAQDDSMKKAAYWYEKAAKDGHPNAKYRYEYIARTNGQILAQAVNERYDVIGPAYSGKIKIQDEDYSFILDGTHGSILERMKKAQQLSDKQVAAFTRVISGLETRINEILLEADIKAGRADATERTRVEGVAKNRALHKQIAEQQEQIDTERSRWRKEQALRIAAGFVIGGLAGDLTSQNLLGRLSKDASGALIVGSQASRDTTVARFERQIADLSVQMTNTQILERQREAILAELKCLKETQAFMELHKDAANTERLIKGYLRQQILEIGVQNCEYVNKTAQKAGINSIDGFIDAFKASSEKRREDSHRLIHESVHNFCLGTADTNDLHIMLAYSDRLAKQSESTPLQRHEQALVSLVERHIKPSIDDYISKASRVDVLKAAAFNLAGKDNELAPANIENNSVLSTLMQANFASEGSLEVNKVFDFYLHRHGKDYLRPTRLNDGLVTDVSEKKRVSVMSAEQKDEFIDRTIHSYKFSRTDLPQVDSIFLRICAAEYFEPQSVITSGKKGTFKENPQAPIAYPMANDVINSFIEKMSLSPIGKYRTAMEDKSAVDALVAQSFIDFFAVLGQSHAKKFITERENLARAFDLKAYGTRFHDCYNAITDDALDQYALFKDIFAQNLQKTLEVETKEKSKKLLDDLEAVKKMGVKGLDPENIIIPGTPEAVERSLRRNRRFENMRPPQSNTRN